MNSYPLAERRTYALPDGTLSGLHFGRTSNPLKLVFAHANGFNAQSYAQILAPLGVHAVALDLRGHGQSTLPTTPKNLADWTVFRDDIIHFCNHYIDRPVLWAGHSFGAVSTILAMDALGDKCAGFVGFDPVIIPPLFGLLTRIPGSRARMKEKIPIAARAGRRRSVFDSAEAAFDNYQGRGVFASISDEILRDYLDGGLSPHDRGVQLSCNPKWEQAVFCAQGHNTYKALRAMPSHRHLYFAGKNSPTPGAVQKRLRRTLGEASVNADDTLSHLFPFERPGLAREALALMLRQISLST